VTLVAVFAIATVAIVVGNRFLRRLDLPWILPAWLGVAGALVASVILAVIHASPYSSQSTEIAWRALATDAANGALQVGGAADSATVGWPSGSFAPRLNVEPIGPRRVRVTVSEGHAFLRAGDDVINGVEVPPSGDTFNLGSCWPFGSVRQLSPQPTSMLGQFGVRVSGRCLEGLVGWLWRNNRFLPPTVEIIDSAGAVVVRVSASSGDRNRVVTLDTLLPRETARLRAQGQAKLAGELENWAASSWLLIPTAGRIRVLDRQATFQADVDLPSRLRIQWPGVSLGIDVDTDSSNRLTAAFLPPWRRASPLPPASANGTWLDITADPQPGDFAFVVPFGSTIAKFRSRVQIESGRFVSQQQQPSLSPFAPIRLTDNSNSESAITSETTVAAGGLRFLIATVQDLPHLWRLDLGVLFALIVLALSCAVTCSGLQRDDAWTVASVAFCVWTLLTIRLLLAYRYAQEPSYIDSLAISGFAFALFGLATIPSVVLLPIRVWRDRHTDFEEIREQHAAGRRVFRLVLAVAMAGALEWWLGYTLWLNAPRSTTTPLIFLGTLALVSVTVAYLVARQYWLNDEELDSEWIHEEDQAIADEPSASGRGPQIQRRRRGTAVWRALTTIISRSLIVVQHAARPEWLAKEFGPRFWNNVGTVADETDSAEQDLPNTWLALGGRALKVFVAIAVLMAILFGVTRLPIPGVKEVLVPILVVWGPAVIWLSSRRRFAPGTVVEHFHWAYAFVLGLLLLFVPAFLTPLLMRDAGGLVASVAVYVPLVVLLWAGGKPRHLAYMATGLLAAGIVLASLFYLNLNQVLPSSYSRLAGQAGVRLLVFKEEVDAERAIPWTPVATTDGRSAFTVNELRQGLEHTWENRAIAYRGGWTGMGYGKAPVRQSQVRQDTLQYDSTFSFYILSEHGLIGGLALLGIYFLPLGIIFVSGKRLFDIGHAFSLLVFSAFFLEAVAQAGMDLGALPFTGRNLPLLAVNSITGDLAKWAVLLALGLQAVAWRSGGEPRVLVDRISILPSAETEPAKFGLVRSQFRRAVVFVIPTAGLLLIATSGITVINDDTLRNPFSWRGLLDEVRILADTGRLRFDAVTQTLEPSLASASTLIEQERLRFNALEPEEKIEGRIGIGDLSNQLRSVRNVGDYDRLMASLRALGENGGSSRRPLLFRIDPARMWADEAATIPTFEPEWAVRANPEYNARVSFDAGAAPEDLPAVRLRAAAATSVVISGRGFQFEVPGRAPRPGESRDIILAAQQDGSLRLVSDSNPQGARAQLLLRFRPLNQRADRTVLIGELEGSPTSVSFRRGELRMRHTEASTSRNRRLIPGQQVQLQPADKVETLDQIGPGLQPGFEIQRRETAAQIGPAWVMGRWRSAATNSADYPWLPQLAQALPDEWDRLGTSAATSLYGELTIDPVLHGAAQRFVTSQGRALHDVLLPARTRDEALPPRIAMSILTLPAGEALALGSWPRMASGSAWERATNGELLPPALWLTSRAPRSFDRRYSGDRNFDRMILGSATKPLIASAALAVHPELDRRLAVRGLAGPDEAVFGIPIRPPWSVESSRALTGAEWADFTSYLVRSDNRYEVRLGFLGLAEREPAAPDGVPSAAGGSPSVAESLDGGRQAWASVPRFPADIEFSHVAPRAMRNLHLTPLAERLEAMFGVGRTVGSRDFRTSFWTGDESDDIRDNNAPAPNGPSSALRALSPEAVDLGLDSIRSPRNFVTLLLGGGSNLWANVDLAAAFGAAVGGVPVVAHITRGAAPKPAPTRQSFQQIAERVRPGLEGVVESGQGTANGWFQRTGALAALKTLAPNVRVYAKTGTLQAARGLPDNSRLVLAVVEWNANGSIARGLVFSIVVERGEQGKSTELLARFIAEHINQIRDSWQQLTPTP